MINFILLIVFLVVAAFAYLLYSEYKEDAIVKGLSLRESPGVESIIDKFVPIGSKKIVMSNKLFSLTNNVSIRDFTLMRIIVFACSIVITLSIAYTTYLNNRTAVFTKIRSVPFVISESDYYALVEGVSFNELDLVQDLNRITSNLTYTSDATKYLTINSDILYDTLVDMNNDLSSLTGFMFFAIFIGLIVFINLLPTIILNQAVKILKSDIDSEFFNLESYISLNADSRVENIIRGLTYEAVTLRKYLVAFLIRYREDSEFAYKLIFESKGLNLQFKNIIEYLYLLETSTPERVREKIEISQDNHLELVTRAINESANKKTSTCNWLSSIALILCLLAIVYGLVQTMDLGGLMF